MTASQHDLSLPLRIEEWPVATTDQANIYEANGRLVCSCDAYDAPEIVRSVNSFRQMREALKAILPYVETGASEGDDGLHLAPLVREALAIAEKETI